ncbi:hypothetical protein [Effusibacillus dendaii]|uniref:Sporulation membrane protein YtrI C-terminal domain-containing protein n=1 Tax=Effusibacillus dendaii TaxID=2743772 RepID=A0A7I8D936_9BACL|nr:hypothetical protein [Effusibacillus dendaii]BCJ86658.1 hypothetical protein skT53_16430 [Effusibacillus dendaii]
MERLALFLVGMLCGATLIVAVKGHDMDLLYLQMGKLRAENNQLQEEVDTLKKSLLDKQKQSKVHKIEVTVTAPDEFTKLAITKYAKDHLRILLDRDLNSLKANPQLVIGLVDGRFFTIENQSYQLKVQILVIDETIHMWIEGIKQAAPT